MGLRSLVHMPIVSHLSCRRKNYLTIICAENYLTIICAQKLWMDVIVCLHLVGRIKLCIIAKCAKLCKFSMRLALNIFTEYAEQTLCCGQIFWMKLCILFTEYAQRNCALQIRPKFRLLQVVNKELRWVLLAKAVSTRTSHASVRTLKVSLIRMSTINNNGYFTLFA